MVTFFERERARRSRVAATLVACACFAPACVSEALIEPVDTGAGGEAGAGGQWSSGGAPISPPPTPAASIGAQVFGDDRVIEVHLTLDEADRLSLELHGNEEIYLPARAELRVDGLEPLELPRIGVRHKGAYTLHNCFDDRTGARRYEGSCARLSYKLKFDKYDVEARFDGLKRLNLHASSGDATRLRELLAYGVFRDFGVEAPRTALAKVYVNGALEGVFIAVEEIDGRFAKFRFPEGGDGNLYKEIWPSPHLDQADLTDALRTNEELADVSAFVEFTAALEASRHATFGADMERWLDLEHTLRYVAVDRALKNWDGIMAFYSAASPHNFYWYHDAEGSGRFQLIPWDMDNTSWNFDPYMNPQGWVTAPPVPDWNEEPSACTPRPVWDQSGDQVVFPPRCDRFLDLLAETHFARFQALAAELLADTFSVSELLERVDRHSALLEPLIEEDPLLDATRWRAERENFKLLLRRSNLHFEDFVQSGLVVEQTPSAPL